MCSCRHHITLIHISRDDVYVFNDKDIGQDPQLTSATHLRNGDTVRFDAGHDGSGRKRAVNIVRTLKVFGMCLIATQFISVGNPLKLVNSALWL